VVDFALQGDFGRVAKDTLSSLVRRLKELRKAHGLTQEAFAERAGFGYKYYQAVEGGRKRQLRLSTLERLAGAYGIEVWELLAPSMPEIRQVTRVKARDGRKPKS